MVSVPSTEIEEESNKSFKTEVVLDFVAGADPGVDNSRVSAVAPAVSVAVAEEAVAPALPAVPALSPTVAAAAVVGTIQGGKDGAKIARNEDEIPIVPEKMAKFPPLPGFVESDVDGRNDDDEEGGPPTKRARTADAEVDDQVLSGTILDVQRAVIKYKQKRGTTYDVFYGKEELTGQSGGNSCFGIKLAAIKVRNAHSFLTHYYEVALGEKYRGRPPMASDQAIIVKSILNTAGPTTRANVQRNDVLLFIDEKLVNITDKKRLKYYMARLNNGARPMKLTFFRPMGVGEEGKGRGRDDEAESMDLDPSEALYVTKYEPPENQTMLISVKPKVAISTKYGRDARRKLLERRLEELEVLHIETTEELSKLRAQDGIVVGKSKDSGKDGAVRELSIKGNEEFVIPPHIMYYPPMKLRRKKLPSLNEACNKVENLLRQRVVIDREAIDIRDVIKQAQMRLDLKDKELSVIDEKITPALEQVKLIEMDVQDNWKTMYLRLKDYYEEHGHSNVMEKEDTKLAKWITRQRTCYANAQLDEPNPSMGIIKPYQHDLLNRLNFSWNPREQQFIHNVAMLRAYREEHGHANVPMKYENMHLANFVQKWRREYRLFQEGKPSNMSWDRLQVLEEAGFTWRDPSRTRKRSDTKQETWDGFLSQLQDFKAKHGHFMVNKVNKTLEKGNRLGRLDEFCGWVRKQYTLFKEGSPCQLTENKVSQLKAMGFWLERGQALRFSQERKANIPQKDKVIQLGQLQASKIDDVADNNIKKTEEDVV